MKVTFKGIDLHARFSRYADNNNIALLLFENLTDPYEYAIASVNGEFDLDDEFIAIKDWSENEGMVEALIESNVIRSTPVGIEHSGFVIIEHYQLTDEAKAEFDKQMNK